MFEIKKKIQVYNQHDYLHYFWYKDDILHMGDNICLACSYREGNLVPSFALQPDKIGGC